MMLHEWGKDSMTLISAATITFQSWFSHPASGENAGTTPYFVDVSIELFACTFGWCILLSLLVIDNLLSWESLLRHWKNRQLPFIGLFLSLMISRGSLHVNSGWKAHRHSLMEDYPNHYDSKSYIRIPSFSGTLLKEFSPLQVQIELAIWGPCQIRIPICEVWKLPFK